MKVEKRHCRGKACLAPTSKIGMWAEDIAAHFLERKGYQILARNFNTRFGEIDIVCQDSRGVLQYAPTLIFTEVRYRGKGSYLLPEETLTTKKQRRIRCAASIYMNRFRLQDANVRFDLVCIYKDKWYMPSKTQHIVDIF